MVIDALVFVWVEFLMVRDMVLFWKGTVLAISGKIAHKSSNKKLLTSYSNFS